MDERDELSKLQTSIHELSAEVRRLHGEVSELQDTFSRGLGDVRAELSQDINETHINERRQISRAEGNIVRQVESMFQLYQKIPVPRAAMPPSGGFPMESRTLLHLSVVLEQLQPKTILELGGGTSTIWMGYLTQKLGTTIISIDHLKEYSDITQDYVHRHEFSDRVECRIAPLVPTTVGNHSYKWYSPSAWQDVSGVDLLLVDGPPESTGERARFPALPMLQEKLSPSAVVILDDTNRVDEAAILREWSALGSGYKQSDVGVSKLGVLWPETTITGDSQS